MTRTQWLVVAFIGVVAVVAYSRTSQIAKYLGISAALDAKPPGVDI